MAAKIACVENITGRCAATVFAIDATPSLRLRRMSKTAFSFTGSRADRACVRHPAAHRPPPGQFFLIETDRGREYGDLNFPRNTCRAAHLGKPTRATTARSSKSSRRPATKLVILMSFAGDHDDIAGPSRLVAPAQSPRAGRDRPGSQCCPGVRHAPRRSVPARHCKKPGFNLRDNPQTDPTVRGFVGSQKSQVSAKAAGDFRP